MPHKDPLLAAQYRREYYLKNKEVIKARVAAWAKANPDCLNEWRRAYQKDKIKHDPAFREKRIKRTKEWKALNPEKVSKARKAYRDARFNGDPRYKQEHKLRGSIPVALKALRDDREISAIGCSGPFFRKHLESLWKPGMSWENYGVKGWHIDHIIPCKNFDLLNPEHQKQCFHYTNMQPLWWHENLEKARNGH